MSPVADDASFSTGNIHGAGGVEVRGHSCQGATSCQRAASHTSAIRAKKVPGTKVEDRSGKKIGEIEDLVLEKQANSILFAVVSFGGFLGMAEKYHAVPRASLDYDEERNSYVA
jgi:PRC-barrel domain